MKNSEYQNLLQGAVNLINSAHPDAIVVNDKKIIQNFKEAAVSDISSKISEIFPHNEVKNKDKVLDGSFADHYLPKSNKLKDANWYLKVPLFFTPPYSWEFEGIYSNPIMKGKGFGKASNGKGLLFQTQGGFYCYSVNLVFQAFKTGKATAMPQGIYSYHLKKNQNNIHLQNKAYYSVTLAGEPQSSNDDNIKTIWKYPDTDLELELNNEGAISATEQINLISLTAPVIEGRTYIINVAFYILAVSEGIQSILSVDMPRIGLFID